MSIDTHYETKLSNESEICEISSVIVFNIHLMDCLILKALRSDWIHLDFMLRLSSIYTAKSEKFKVTFRLQIKNKSPHEQIIMHTVFIFA
jgi:hypothetical protein